MADDPDTTLQNAVIVGMDEIVAHILRNTASQTRCHVKQELAELDFEMLRDNRLLLFDQAKKLYEEKLRQNGVEEIVQIEPKCRRKHDTTSADIIDLYLYGMGVREDFPRDCIKDLRVFIETPFTPEDLEDDECDKTDGKQKERDSNGRVREGVGDIGGDVSVEVLSDSDSEGDGKIDDPETVFIRSSKCWFLKDKGRNHSYS